MSGRRSTSSGDDENSCWLCESTLTLTLYQHMWPRDSNDNKCHVSAFLSCKCVSAVRCTAFCSFTANMAKGTPAPRRSAKAMSPEPEPEAASDSHRSFPTSETDKSIWLLKLPNTLSERLRRGVPDDQEIGELRIYHQ